MCIRDSSYMFIMVPLCGMCFISVMVVMSGNSCPVFIACMAKLDFCISGFLFVNSQDVYKRQRETCWLEIFFHPKHQYVSHVTCSMC